MSDVIKQLVKTIKSRKGHDIKSSYTSFLLSKGNDYCFTKLKEELVEFEDAIKEHANHPLIVNYSIVISNKKIEDIPTLTSKETPVPPGYQRKSQLNSRYTFENFIEGKSNQFARAAAISVTDKPGQTLFNPLLVYSTPGLGKTPLNPQFYRGALGILLLGECGGRREK